nr:BsuBI/PstI family type II restriction endonuclease [uncultured Acetatifactor sp.]
MDYKKLPTIDYRTFNRKSDKVQKLIRQSLQIINALGIPIDDLTERQKEKMAMAFLAVGDVKTSAGWKKIKDSNNEYSLTTREIIAYENKYFEENISSGSYDDIKRKDLSKLLLAMIVVNSKPGSNTSNPTRGYKINSEYSRIIKNYGQSDWFMQVEAFNKMHPTYAERVKEIHLKDGEHNAIQKQVIEELLPRFGYGAVLLYCGDSDNKYGLIFEKEKLTELGFSDLTQSILPDVVAYSSEKDWIYLVEAYHTSNPITPQRKLELQQILGEKADKAVFITAFENNSAYRNCSEELAWETEVWIATEPDHMIHRDGFRFMGPYGDNAFNDRLHAYIAVLRNRENLE